MYEGKADWGAIAEAAKIIRSEGTIFLGNGDVENREDAAEKIQKYGVDGVLIGRGAWGNPWVFTGEKAEKKKRLEVAVEHSRKFEETFPEDRFFIMRKHLAWYAHGFTDATDLRQKLVMTNSADEVEEVLRKVI
jgi:tRNA-dihydrouridine synthase